MKRSCGRVTVPPVAEPQEVGFAWCREPVRELDPSAAPHHRVLLPQREARMSWYRCSPASCGSRRRDARAQPRYRSDGAANVQVGPVSKPRACRLAATGREPWQALGGHRERRWPVGEDAIAASGVECVELEVRTLIGGGHTRVA